MHPLEEVEVLQAQVSLTNHAVAGILVEVSHRDLERAALGLVDVQLEREHLKPEGHVISFSINTGSKHCQYLEPEEHVISSLLKESSSEQLR